jgi:hypothetical protein
MRLADFLFLAIQGQTDGHDAADGILAPSYHLAAPARR